MEKGGACRTLPVGTRTSMQALACGCEHLRQVCSLAVSAVSAHSVKLTVTGRHVTIASLCPPASSFPGIVVKQTSQVATEAQNCSPWPEVRLGLQEPEAGHYCRPCFLIALYLLEQNSSLNLLLEIAL